MQRFPFVTRLADFPQETEGLHRIPIAVTGSWTKDGNKFSITFDDLKQMVNNFAARKNGKLVVDYEHASENPKTAKGGPIPAAGWIEAMELVGATVFASIDWTKDAAQMIKDKAYRFVSPAIDWFATNKESGEAVGTALSSLALTNHPFLEELPALCLSDKSNGEEDGKNVIHVPVPDGASVKVKVKASDIALDDTGAILADKLPYGDVEYADPGLQEDKKKRYPLDTEAHIRAAWSYIGMDKNASKYEADQVKTIKGKIVAAWKDKIDKEGPPAAKENASTMTLSEMSLDQKRTAVYDAIRKDYNPWPGAPYGNASDGPWVQDLYEDHAIVQCNGKLWKVGYAMDDKANVTLQPPTQVKLEYVEASAMSDKEKLDAELSDKAKNDAKAKDAKAKQDAKDAEDKAEAKGEPADGEDDAQLSDAGQLTTKAGATIPRLAIRKIKAGDAVGKLGHHAVLDNGKMLGYMTHGDLMTHAAKFAEPPKEAQMSATTLTDAIKEATGRPFTLGDVKEHIEFSVNHRDEFAETARAGKARKMLLTEGFTEGVYDPKKARRLLASNKITLQDYCDVEEASDEVGTLINDGKFLPSQRQDLISLCLTDKELFVNFTKAQAKVIEFAEAGFHGNGAEATKGGNVDAEIMQLTDKLMKEDPKMKRGEAHRKVMMTNTDLAKRYNDAHRKNLQ